MTTTSVTGAGKGSATAFLPLLRRSSGPVVVNVGGGRGSPAITHDPSRARDASSTAPVRST
ncbi:hypothetical protein ACWD7F_09345 [Streptomyces sp. NPDC005122]